MCVRVCVCVCVWGGGTDESGRGAWGILIMYLKGHEYNSNGHERRNY